MPKEVDEEFTIGLFDLAFYLWSKMYWILAAVGLTALVGGLYGIFGAPEYLTRSVISPNAPRSTLGSLVEVFPGSGTGVALLETRLVSRSISERVAELEPDVAKVLFPAAWDGKRGQWESGSGPTAVSIGGRLRREHLEVVSNSRKDIVEILVTMPDSAYAKRIGDAYLRALKESIQENISNELEENRIFLEAQAVQAQDPQIQIRIQSLIARNVEMALVNNPKDFQVVEYPAFPTGKAAPNFLKSVVIGILLGGFGIVAILFGLFVVKSLVIDWQKRKDQPLV